MIGFIYKLIQYYLTERVKDIKYISLYNNQFQDHVSNRSIPTPAVLIEILPINFDDLLNNVQYSKVNINIHIGTDNYNGYDRDDIMQDNSLEHLELLDKIYIALNRVTSLDLPDDLKNEMYIQGEFRRNSVTIDTYNSTIHHSIINGSFMLFDLSAVKKYQELELEDIKLKTFYIPNPPFEGELQAKEINIK